jgi:hypothetical protein
MVIPDLSQADIALIGFGGSTPAPVRIIDAEGIVVFITCHLVCRRRLCCCQFDGVFSVLLAPTLLFSHLSHVCSIMVLIISLN